jgi:Ca-activated chloride channel family protein
MNLPVIDYSSLFFGTPLLLLSLLGIPLYFLWRGVYLKKNKQLIVQFTGVNVLKQLQEKNKKNMSFILALSACVLVGLALGNPIIKITTNEETANVMLVIDISGSMKAIDVPPDRLTVAKNSAKNFVQNLPASWKAGLVAFSEQPIVLSPPTFDIQDLTVKIDSLKPDRGTATGDAVWEAIDVGRSGGFERLEESYAQGDNLLNPSETVIVLLSDGAQTGGLIPLEQSIERARKLNIPIYTIALGTDSGEVDILNEFGELVTLPVPPDKEAMIAAAQQTGGLYFEAQDLNDLTEIYETVSGVLEPIQQDYPLNSVLIILAVVLIITSGLIALKAPRGKI